MSMNINALVCGNGPSLKNIDYKRGYQNNLMYLDAISFILKIDILWVKM